MVAVLMVLVVVIIILLVTLVLVARRRGGVAPEAGTTRKIWSQGSDENVVIGNHGT